MHRSYNYGPFNALTFQPAHVALVYESVSSMRGMRKTYQNILTTKRNKIIRQSLTCVFVGDNRVPWHSKNNDKFKNVHFP